VGPVFTPGNSACWTCLADRMKRNRKSRRSLIADRPAASLFPLWPGTRSDRVPSNLQPSRSQKRSPPISARSCATTLSASTCWAQPS
jgi:bacteriocin biosynthesis cyclodehydratase domain-containing protein